MFEALARTHQSHSVAFADFVRNREAGGHRVIKMQTGDPDFATHPNIIRAAHQAMLAGETKYCDSRGLSSLRDALSDKLAAENSISVSATENILITHGAVHGIGMAIRALINPGDEVIIQEPFWRAYQADVILAGGVPVIVQARSESGFQLEAERLLERISPRTKAILINTPNNPSGAVYSQQELAKLAIAAAAQGIYLISDEVYESIIFDDNNHYSIASDPSVFDWTVTAFSFSKTHAMTGWRIGYVVASKIIIDEILKLSQYSITSLSPFSQLAALAALTDADACDYSINMRTEYQRRRDKIVNAISGTWLEKGMTSPNGTFYGLIDASRFNMPSLELAKQILNFSNVSFTPGIAFGDAMDSYLRMCFASSQDNIDQAIEALIKFERIMTNEM